MVSSRDRSHSQRRDSVVSTIARTPPPAFLFPIQRCQRPDRFSPDPAVFRRRVGGGGYLVTGLPRVNRPFEAFAGRPGCPGFWPQKPPRAAEGLPSHVRSDSIEARENTHLREKIKCLSAARFSSRIRAPTRAGGGYLVAVPSLVNRLFRGIFAALQKLRILTKPHRHEDFEGHPSWACWRCRLMLVDMGVLLGLSRPCGPVSCFEVRPAPEREALSMRPFDPSQSRRTNFLKNRRATGWLDPKMKEGGEGLLPRPRRLAAGFQPVCEDGGSRRRQLAAM
jgi:hypothetical protein